MKTIKIARALLELNKEKFLTHSLFSSENQAEAFAIENGFKFICWPFPCNSEREIEVNDDEV